VTAIMPCPAGGSPVSLIDSTGAVTGSITPATGSTQVILTLQTPLISGDSVMVQQGTANSNCVTVTDPLDLGRVRYYFTSGVVISNSQGFQLQSSSSQAGVFLGLDADRSWLVSNRPGWRRVGLNTYFDARLTSVATQGSTSTTSSTSTSSTSTSSTSTSPTPATANTALSSFLQSQKAGALQAGTYIPIITAEWMRGTSNYAFFVAPLGKAGFTTLTDSPTAPASSSTTTTTTTTTTSLPLTGQFYTSYSFGTRLGVFQTFKKGTAWDENSAPELVSYVDITTGKFGNFEAFQDVTVQTAPAGTTAASTDNFFRIRPWRYSFEGLLKIPHSPFVVGFNANIGRGAVAATKVNNVSYPFTQPRDDLRFLFGVQFDFTKLLKAIPSL
jgi:hypothetical protein